MPNSPSIDSDRELQQSIMRWEDDGGYVPPEPECGLIDGPTHDLDATSPDIEDQTVRRYKT